MLRLLNFLLNHLMFGSTMFFAAGAAIVPGAAGGAGDGQGSADAGSGGDGGGDTGGDVDGAAGSGADGAADVDVAADSGDAAAQDQDAPVDLGNGRTVPAKIDKLFKLAKTQGLEKEVRNLYFADQRLKKALPGGVNEAIELVNSIEQFGGVEGIEQLQSDLEMHNSDAELFETNPQKWIEESFKENAESSLAAFDHALAIVADKNPEHYDHVMAKVVLETLDNGSPVAHIYNLLASLKDNPQAQAAAQKLAAWYNAVKDTASKIPEKKVDARQKELSDREAQVEQREMGTRYTQVNAEVFPAMKSQVQRTLEAEAKLVSVDLTKLAADYPGAFKGMMEEIHKQIMQTAIKDQRFVDKHYALVKKGDLKRAAAAVNAKHEKIIPEIVRTVAAASGLLKGQKKAANADQGGKRAAGNNDNANANADANAGWTRVSAKPANHLIDYHKTSQSMQLDGRYILKDGKRVVVHY